MLAPDIQKWQRELDSILVQELNDISFEIEHHEGKKWEHEKELLKDEYKKTVLYGLINKTDKEAMILLSAILTNYAVMYLQTLRRQELKRTRRFVLFLMCDIAQKGDKTI